MSGGIPAKSGAEWLRDDGNAGDVVMSSRIRLARNIAGFPFVKRASKGERQEVLDLARGPVMEGGLAEQMMWVDMASLPRLERRVLVERHLVSKQHSKGNEPRAVAVSSPDERLSIMVNEEDHLRIQVLRSGFNFAGAFEQIDEVDNRIESQVEYAFSPRFGYLTACPTNVGTGIRVSVMLHLPGLRITGDIEKVQRAAKGMNLAVRGFYVEGSDAVGDVYQFSNQTTIGCSERDVVCQFETNIIPKVIEYERIARRTLMPKRRTHLEDQVWRALGVLRGARLMKAEEAMRLLSAVRLGIVSGVVQGVEASTVNQLLLLSQPAHLQKVTGREMEQSERTVERATLIRKHLHGADS